MIRDYFGDSLEISSYIKNGKNCVANIKCNIHSQSDVDNFIKIGTREANEILKLNFNKGKQRKVCTVCKWRTLTDIIMVQSTQTKEHQKQSKS